MRQAQPAWRVLGHLRGFSCATLGGARGGEWNSPRDAPDMKCGDRLFFNATETFWGVGGSA